MLTKTLILTSTYPTELSSSNVNTHHCFRRQITIGLHVAGLVVSLCGIAFFSSAIPRWNANFFHNSGPNRGDWTDGFALGPLTFAFLYHAAVLIYDQAQKRRRQTPALPSLSTRSLIIHTTVTVLIMTIMIPALFIAGYGSLFRFWRPAVRTQSGFLVCNMLNVFARECEPVLYVVGSLQIAGIVFGTLLWVLHFILLLIALRDMRRHRLVKQLQREKLAQFDSSSQKSWTPPQRSRPIRSPSSSAEARADSRSNSVTYDQSTRTTNAQLSRNNPGSVVQQPELTHTRSPSTGPQRYL